MAEALIQKEKAWLPYSQLMRMKSLHKSYSLRRKWRSRKPDTRLSLKLSHFGEAGGTVKFLHVSRSTIQGMIKRGNLKARRMDKE